MTSSYMDLISHNLKIIKFQMSKIAMSSSSSAAVSDDESRIKCAWAVSKNANLYIQPLGNKPIKVGRITGGKFKSKHKTPAFETVQKVCIVTVAECEEQESQDLDSSVSHESKSYVLLESNFQLNMSHTGQTGNKNSVELDQNLCARFVNKTSQNKGRWFRDWVTTEAIVTQEQSFNENAPYSPIAEEKSDSDDVNNSDVSETENFLGKEVDYTGGPADDQANPDPTSGMTEYLAGSQASVTGTQADYTYKHVHIYLTVAYEYMNV